MSEDSVGKVSGGLRASALGDVSASSRSPERAVPTLPYAERVRQELKTRCVHLRTKAAFLPLPQEGDEENPFATAIWWCGRTCAALGADGSAAHPSLCYAPGRTCYEPPPGR